MTPIDNLGTDKSGAALRLTKAALPLFIVSLLFWFLSKQPSPHPMATFVVFVACALVLWFGWTSIRRNIGTKWFGILLGSYIVLVLGLFVLGVAVGVGLALLPAFLVALPFVLYDLLFRAPFKGRFERARAERRHLRS